MISQVTYLGNLRTEATHSKSGTKIITDAPIDNKGKGEAFSPTDLVATALASCMLTIMGIIAEKDNININSTTAKVHKIMSQNPRRIDEVVVSFIFNDPLNKKERRKLEKAAKTCPVSASLSGDLKETVEFIYQ